MVERLIRLDEFQSRDIFKYESRGPGVYTFRNTIAGNSLLSSLYVGEADPGASVKINYYQQTTGRPLSERSELTGHEIVSGPVAPPGITQKRTITRIHNAPIAEAVVTGGNVSFGVLITVVSSFASDLDAALHFDGDAFEPENDKGLPIVCLDRDTGTYSLISCKDGGIGVNPNPGEPVNLFQSTTIVAPTVQDLFTYTVPATSNLAVSDVRISSRVHSSFELLVDGAPIGGGMTCPTSPNGSIQYAPRKILPPNTEVKLQYRAVSQSPSMCVYSHFNGSLLEI